jgi:hypothetical protein
VTPPWTRGTRHRVGREPCFGPACSNDGRSFSEAGGRRPGELLGDAESALASEGEIVEAMQVVWDDYRETPVF